MMPIVWSEVPLADMMMINQMWCESPDGQAAIQRALDGLPHVTMSVTIEGGHAKEILEPGQSLYLDAGHRVGIDPTCGGTFDIDSGACDRCAAIDEDRAGLPHDWP